MSLNNLYNNGSGSGGYLFTPYSLQSLYSLSGWYICLIGNITCELFIYMIIVLFIYLVIQSLLYMHFTPIRSIFPDIFGRYLQRNLDY